MWGVAHPVPRLVVAVPAGCSLREQEKFVAQLVGPYWSRDWVSALRPGSRLEPPQGALMGMCLALVALLPVQRPVAAAQFGYPLRAQGPFVVQAAVPHRVARASAVAQTRRTSTPAPSRPSRPRRRTGPETQRKTALENGEEGAFSTLEKTLTGMSSHNRKETRLCSRDVRALSSSSDPIQWFNRHRMRRNSPRMRRASRLLRASLRSSRRRSWRLAGSIARGE